jgi:flagellar protein FliS
MQTKQKYQAYAAATQTVAKTQQIVMLYDGTIRFLQQARVALENKRIEERCNLLIKASAIMNGLQACLDFEKGGEIAKVLYNFYADVGGRIFSIHRTQNVQVLDDVLADIKRMRDVWQEIDQNNLDPKDIPPVAATTTTTTTTESTSSAPPSSVPPSDNVTLSA